MQPRSQRHGHSSDDPLVLGVDDGSQVLLVETTGLAFGLHKGQQRWVTGTDVFPGVAAGLLMVINAALFRMDLDFKEADGGQVVQGSEAAEEPASATQTGGSPEAPSAGPVDDAEGYAAVAAAHAAYEADRIAELSIPKTKLWVGDDLARAEAVEAQESAGQQRKGLLDHVNAMLDAELTEPVED